MIVFCGRVWSKIRLFSKFEWLLNDSQSLIEFSVDKSTKRLMIINDFYVHRCYVKLLEVVKLVRIRTQVLLKIYTLVEQLYLLNFRSYKLKSGIKLTIKTFLSNLSNLDEIILLYSFKQVYVLFAKFSM